MKKIFIMVVVVLILIIGCTNTNSQLNNDTDTQVPFLTYYQEQDGKIDVKLSMWDIDQGTITFSDDLVYSIKNHDNYHVEPIIWDGNKKLILHKIATPKGLYKSESEVIEKYPMDSIYGRDIMAVRNRTVDGEVSDYDLFLNCSDGVVEKKVKAQYQTIDGEKEDIMFENDGLCYIDFNKSTGEITLMFSNWKECCLLYVGKCNINDINDIQWKKIVLPDAKQTGGGYSVTPNNTVLIGSRYYIGTAQALTEVDIDTGESKINERSIQTCKSTVKEGKFVPDYLKNQVQIVGGYKDIAILDIEVYGDEQPESLICAIRDGEFKGAIHIREDGIWNVIDSEKKVTAIIDNKNKELYKEFGIDFIAFPMFSNSI